MITRVRADLHSKLDGYGAVPRWAMPAILGPVLGTAVFLLHRHLAWIELQLYSDKSDDDMMLREAALYGIRKIPATFAQGTGVVTATGVNGSTISEGDTLIHATKGTRYEVTADATIASGTASLSVIALAAGADSNLDVGETLQFEAPISGVDSDATVSGDGIAGGNPESTPEQVRARLIARKQQPPAGGRDADYIAWARLVAGVTRVWVSRHENGLGTVVVRFVFDDRDDIFPTVQDVADVQAIIDDKRPTAVKDALAVAPIETVAPLTISITPSSDARKDAINANLEDLFQRIAQPGKADGTGTISIEALENAIGNALDLSTDSFDLVSPTTSLVPAVGRLLTLGTITWA